MNNYLKNYNYLTNMLPANQGMQVELENPYEGFIKGNMFKNLYRPYKINTPYEIRPMNEQAEMLTNIDSLDFATIDLNLYLDIYSNNKDVINLFNHYREQKVQLENMYQNKYGPLELNSEALNTYPWAWDNKPWPWEN